jgi:putative oxidoreductase
MQRSSLLFLRVSLGGLMVYWGVDKLINVKHGLTVAEKFYGGMPVAERMMQLFGGLQIVLGGMIIVGLLLRFAYPALLLVTGTTLIAVWKSIVDPFKLMLDGGNLMFYPSLIIFAGALVLFAFRAEDRLVLDRPPRRS